MIVNNSHNDGARETNKIKNRQAIIEAGIQTFIAKGVAETTVRDIIRSTGLASGTFYNYFKSKEDVLVAIFDDFAKEIVKLDSTDNPVLAKYLAMQNFEGAELRKVLKQ